VMLADVVGERHVVALKGGWVGWWIQVVGCSVC
jgi:hypothetical protein